MRTTVSDILLFQKCPYAWYIKEINRRVPIAVSPALEFGTKVHKEFQELLTYWMEIPIEQRTWWPGEKTPLNSLIGDVLATDIDAFIKKMASFNIVAVEAPFELNIGGHTILGTPDAILQDRTSLQFSLFQLKSVGAMKAHLPEYVRISTYECIYNLWLKETYIAADNLTTVCHYVKTKQPKVVTTQVWRSDADIEASRQYVVRICNQMEEMTLGAQTEGWQTPSSCIDYFTGQYCGYFVHCHQGGNLLGPGFGPTKDRYNPEQEPSPEP